MKRRGFSLLELMVVVALLGVVMAIGGQVLTALFRLQRQSLADIDQRRTLAALATRLREDAHAALESRLVDSAKLQLIGSGGLIMEYAIEGSRIDCRVLRGDQIVRRESFRLPRTSALALEVDAGSEVDGSLVRVVVKPSGITSRLEPAPLPAVIEAAVGITATPQEAAP